MPIQHELRTLMRLARATWSSGVLLVTALFAVVITVADEAAFRERLSRLPFKIAHEKYVNDNWEIFVMNADGSDPVNLTQTPKEHELYPQMSPDGSKICFTVQAGEGRETVRSIWFMDLNAQHRIKVADYGR